MALPSISLILLLFVVFVHISAIPSFPTHHRSLTLSKKRLLLSCTQDCNATCQRCENNTCIIDDKFCFIGGLCYQQYQTRLNDSSSCLQCQLNNSKTQWSFNLKCSAGNLCLDKMLIAQNTCPRDIIEGFYINSREAIIELYNFNECSRDVKLCQSGFFLPKNSSTPLACCPGHFCPEGQVCMIPCREGSYCPSPLQPMDGTCRTIVQCPENQPKDFGQYGCGGSTFEGFCPAESYCPNSSSSILCTDNTKYCPTGVQEPMPCPTGFVCVNGRARRQRIITIIVTVVVIIIVVYACIAMISQWLILEKKIFGEHKLVDPPGISGYFRKRDQSQRAMSQFQLNIHLSRAQLRNVTRFNLELNPGFTGQITAGRLTALMGGSGCGKSSLLETIHGRRRLHKNGSITFAEHKPLSNQLTDYIGYVPQADVMHNDLTVFETVFYSARTRRLGDSKKTIINDVCFVLKRLGLERMNNSMTRTLSGGQRKRVNVAMEIVACPKVLLLDEPTSGLDTVSCDDLFDLLQLIKYNSTGPVTIIMIIHQPSQELFEKIDDIFFLTPLCCLAYQGPRSQANEYLKQTIFSSNPEEYPPPRHNDCDTCFIMLTQAQHHIDNHQVDHQKTIQPLETYSWYKRVWLPFFYVMSRSIRQMYVRRAIAEATYLFAYFLLGACLGYLFENKQQGTCDIQVLPTIYFLISLAFGILTCISSQRLFGIEMIDQTFERESRTYFHPLQYWLAKSFVDIIRMIFYPLLFISMLYVEIVPRGTFSYYLGVMILLSFVCSSIGQLTSVIFNRTEYAYLAGTIVALLSCLLSGFSPTKSELGRGDFIVQLSFSRHVQNLLFRYETTLYIQQTRNDSHIWSASVEELRIYYSFSDNENPYLWLILIGFILRGLTFIFLYAKSEYRSQTRFHVTHVGPTLKSLLSCKRCRQ